jgi:hypothetical protein
MSVKIDENKKSATTHIGVDDCAITPGKMMYDNIDVKFPVKKPPANNECFAKVKVKAKRKSKRLAKRRQKYKN